MSIKQLGEIWVIQMRIIGCIGSVFSIPFILIFVQTSARFKANNLWELIRITDFIRIIVFVLILLILTVVPSVKYLKKKGIRYG